MMETITSSLSNAMQQAVEDTIKQDCLARLKYLDEGPCQGLIRHVYQLYRRGLIDKADYYYLAEAIDSL